MPYNGTPKGTSLRWMNSVRMYQNQIRNRRKGVGNWEGWQNFRKEVNLIHVVDYPYKSVVCSSQGSHTGQLGFGNWLADDSTTGECDYHYVPLSTNVDFLNQVHYFLRGWVDTRFPYRIAQIAKPHGIPNYLKEF